MIEILLLEGVAVVTTICLALRAFHASIPFKKIKETFFQKLAWMLPRDLVYWCAIRVWANATMGKHSSQEASTVTAQQMLKRWKP